LNNPEITDNEVGIVVTKLNPLDYKITHKLNKKQPIP